VLLAATHTNPTAANTACQAAFPGYSAHLLTFASASEAFDATAPGYNIQSRAMSISGIAANNQLWLGASQTSPGTTSADKW
jgi:hypothetical protein